MIGENLTAFTNFKINPITMQYSIYFLNITNAESVKQNKFTSVKNLQFQQVGPYVFDENREKINIAFDENEDTVVYNHKKEFHFNQNLSGELKLDDKVNIINIFLVCILYFNISENFLIYFLL